MEVRVKCDFPYIKVMGELKESDNCITFRGINADRFEYVDKNGKKKEAGMFVFNAFGEMKDRVKKLKIQKGSEISIGAYMKKWYATDENKDNKGQQYANYSFNVYAVDFLPARYHKADGNGSSKPSEANSKSSVNESTHKAQPERKVINNTSPENVDIADLERMFG